MLGFFCNFQKSAQSKHWPNLVTLQLGLLRGPMLNSSANFSLKNGA
jgi:hypothetical protein